MDRWAYRFDPIGQKRATRADSKAVARAVARAVIRPTDPEARINTLNWAYRSGSPDRELPQRAATVHRSSSSQKGRSHNIIYTLG